MKYRVAIIIRHTLIKYIKTTERLQEDNFVLILCFHSVCRICNAIIEIGRQMQNNGRSDVLLTCQIISYLNTTLSSSMKTGRHRHMFEWISGIFTFSLCMKL